MRAATRETDVVVSGGGPAGLAAAIAARLAGFRVVLADHRRPPIDKACGEGILPRGVALLERLGITLPFGATVPFAGIRFVDGEVVATGRFPRSPGIAVRRTVLHRAMMQRADELGVECLWGSRVVGLHEEGIELQHGMVRSRWVIGADGKHSSLRRSLGPVPPPLRQRVGIRRHYVLPPWSEFVEVHWAAGCEAYVTPVGRSLICVAMLLDDPSLRFDAALERLPALRRRLADGGIASSDLGDVTMVRRCPVVGRGRLALVGEASGSVDAITGEGITLALQQSLALASSLRRGDLGLYARRHGRLMRIPGIVSDILLGIGRHPLVRRGVLRTLAGVPGLFSCLLVFHPGALPRTGRPGRPSPTGSGDRSASPDPRDWISTKRAPRISTGAKE